MKGEPKRTTHYFDLDLVDISLITVITGAMALAVYVFKSFIE